jgi:hypothetical protein
MYHNKEWLEQKYLEEKLNTVELGEMCNVNNTTIGRRLKKYNIPIRSNQEAHSLVSSNHCNLSQKAIEWINGELLGDGCLFIQTQSSAKFQYGSKHKEYIKYISKTLDSFGMKQSGKLYERFDKKYRSYSYYYQSHYYKELLELYRQWYPNGKKVIPEDIVLTPTTLRQHYIGDGSLIHTKDNKPNIKLYTNGFSISGVEWLVRQLLNLFFKATRQKAMNVIYISNCSVKKFLNYIGKCPVKCYQYKWDY